MRFAWIFIAILAVSWCSENSTNISLEDKSSVSAFKQVSGCLQSSLLKTGTPDISCFDYSFHENLTLDFCLPANCCPDSNRFDYSYKIRNDTIYFAVLDTALDLCDCICTYKIKTEISGLSEDAYIFNCFYNGSTVYDTLVYRRFD